MAVNTAYRKILLAGAGELGSRHLQGLLKSPISSTIDVIDPSENSINLSISRMNEIPSLNLRNHQVNFYSGYEQLESRYDLCINATSSATRRQSIEAIGLRCDYWVLEKVLTTNQQDWQIIRKVLKGCAAAWVNKPRRYNTSLMYLKKELTGCTLKKLSVHGKDWSLACNSVHFLDLAKWLSSASLISVSTAHLSKLWRNSKREGYFDVLGKLNALYDNGMEVELSSGLSDCELQIDIFTKKNLYTIDRSASVITKNDERIAEYTELNQSSATTEIVTDIFTCGTSKLPTIEEAGEIHLIFLKAFLEHWRRTMNLDAIHVPIT